MVVRPCQPFSVTLIGRRLWRSTVRLGGERATKIIVMPNMNGIVASFDKVPRPGNLPNDRDEGQYFAPLVVWTSQGIVQLPQLIAIEPTPPDEAACAKDSPR